MASHDSWGARLPLARQALLLGVVLLAASPDASAFLPEESPLASSTPVVAAPNQQQEVDSADSATDGTTDNEPLQPESETATMPQSTTGRIDPADSLSPIASSGVGLEVKRAKRDASDWIHNSRVALPELGRLQARAALPSALRELERQLPSQTEDVYAAAERARERIRSATRWFTVADVEYELRQRLVELSSVQKRVDSHLKKANFALERVGVILSEAQRSSDEAKRLDLEGDVRAQIRHVVREANLAQRNVQRSVAAALRLQSGLTDLTDELNQVLELSVTEGPSLGRDLTRKGPNVMALLLRTDPRLNSRTAITSIVSHHIGTARKFLSVSVNRLLGHVLLGLGILVAMLWLRSRANRLPEFATHANPRQLVHRPLATAALLTTATTWLVYPTCPAIVLILAFSVAVLLGLWLLPAVTRFTKVWHRRVLGAVWLVDVSRILFLEIVRLEYVLLLVEGVIGVVALAFVLRQQQQDGEVSQRWGIVRRWVLRFWLAAFLIGSLALGAGLVQTGTILISAAISSVFAAVVWAALRRILASSIELLEANGAAQQTTGPRLGSQLLARHLQTALTIAASFLWLRTSLDSFTWWDPTVEALQGLMELSAEAGALKLSVGGVVALLTGLVLAIYGAKLVRSVLEVDILPRTKLAVGTRAATSTSIYFGVLAVGIFLAIVATGVELDKLTVIVGALSVGIGFGLQNLVQNFVAGLILIFGRPVNVEDRIQLGELTGIVRRIGFRASILRTFKGAEVIVPNSDLISAQVINWTLSDQERRMEINIGVAYGTDPEQVLQLLLNVARANPDVLAQPEPDALFLAHGASSLDFQLRAWTNNVGGWPNIQSDLTVAINRALKAADIEIPFPQHDLHLRSVDLQVMKTLETK
jgi:potassium-dependent mechanosensitive channel